MNSTTTTVDVPIREPRNVQELADLVKYFISFVVWHHRLFYHRFKIQSLKFKKNLDKRVIQFWQKVSIIDLNKFFHQNFFLVDDMGRRIDDLERNIANIISQTNAELP